ncbi:MAG TPA: hypothetical protein VEF03_07845 [Candidatus Binataceae bacterium]|nr:hypothetical protein [Candidatus Binataceae bacterium]
MKGASIAVETPRSRPQLVEFARLPYAIYADREAWWPPDVENEIDLICGRSALSGHLEIEPFCARVDNRLCARVSAVVNHRYIDHWKENVGQLIHFEALPGCRDAVVAMFEDAIRWLRGRGMTAVRSGFAAFLDYPYAIDNYDAFPSFLLRSNPDYYHSYFKNAGFETEKGQLDYTAVLTPSILDRYHGMIDAASRAGVQIRSWREFGYLAAIDAWTDITNIAFARHWAWNPVARSEVRPMLTSMWDTPVADLSMIAMLGGRPVGAVFSVPDMSVTLASVRRGARLNPERGGGTRGALINVGVVDEARGRGIARAMAARSFLEMSRRSMRYAGYTLVLDDNWPSRRTAESLGAHVTSNFVTYRRELASSRTGARAQGRS